MGATIEARDPLTQGHCQRLAAYATRMGRALGLDAADLAALERGGFLHDIGKVAVPDSVLLKGGKLDPQESRVMREHPIVGDAICTGLRSLQKVRPIVRHHHEHLDGTGYPDGLKNAQVPLLAQIVGIVDVFDALTSDRPYHTAVSPDAALDVVSDEASKGWRDRVARRRVLGCGEALTAGLPRRPVPPKHSGDAVRGGSSERAEAGARRLHFRRSWRNTARKLKAK